MFIERLGCRYFTSPVRTNVCETLEAIAPVGEQILYYDSVHLVQRNTNKHTQASIRSFVYIDNPSAIHDLIVYTAFDARSTFGIKVQNTIAKI